MKLGNFYFKKKDIKMRTLYAKLKIKIYHTWQEYMQTIFLPAKNIKKQQSILVKLQELLNKFS